ncbi:YbaB/EbfC family nucleoid-associated protein [Nocardia sp. CA-128927]|uniref:YbaB/EbfC family nucleoid-associated protein n=1 Tax=Nocardia sp. CA-128927 TaxID=3239975 RepID=UPI003D97965E
MSEHTDFDAAVEEIKSKAHQVRSALARVRGKGTAGNGAVTAIVDSNGRLRDLRLSREALRYGDRLAELILQATADAETDAATKAQQATRPLTDDHRVQAGLATVTGIIEEPASAPRQPMSEDEIRAADDAYFERLNRGWTS